MTSNASDTMRAELIAAVMAIGLASQSAAHAAAGFAGYWTQDDAAHPCSVVRGFDLNRDGSATADWADAQQRQGTWSATAGTLHLRLTDPGTPPTELTLEGKQTPDHRLHTTMTDTRDRNIDGAPYTIACTYVRARP